MAKKPLLSLPSLPSNAQLVSDLGRITKALLWKGAGVIILFQLMPQIYFFFQLPNLNKYCWGLKRLLGTR